MLKISLNVNFLKKEKSRLKRTRQWRLTWWATTRTRSSSLTRSLTKACTRWVENDQLYRQRLQNLSKTCLENVKLCLEKNEYEQLFKALVKRGERRFSHKALLGALMICMYRQADHQSLSKSPITMYRPNKTKSPILPFTVMIIMIIFNIALNAMCSQ